MPLSKAAQLRMTESPNKKPSPPKSSRLTKGSSKEKSSNPNTPSPTKRNNNQGGEDEYDKYKLMLDNNGRKSFSFDGSLKSRQKDISNNGNSLYSSPMRSQATYNNQSPICRKNGNSYQETAMPPQAPYSGQNGETQHYAANLSLSPAAKLNDGFESQEQIQYSTDKIILVEEQTAHGGSCPEIEASIVEAIEPDIETASGQSDKNIVIKKLSPRKRQSLLFSLILLLILAVGIGAFTGIYGSGDDDQGGNDSSSSSSTGSNSGTTLDSSTPSMSPIVEKLTLSPTVGGSFLQSSTITPSTKPSSTSSPTITKVPSPSPTVSLSPTSKPTSGTFKDLLNVIKTVTDVNLLLDVSKSQGKAFEWMVSHFGDTDDPDKTIQRFSLATLYFETNGENWTNSTGWLSDQNECKWWGILCVKGYIHNLTLSGNKLKGDLPEEIYQWSSLQHLEVDNNELKGTLSSAISNWKNLRYGEFDGNKFEGNLPPEIFLLTKAVRLDLEENKFSGQLPTTLSDMSNLTQLRLEGNNFSGTIPSELGKLVLIERLALHKNDFVGEMPKEVCSLRQINPKFTLLYADCQKGVDINNKPIEAQLQCSCCTGCFV